MGHAIKTCFTEIDKLRIDKVTQFFSVLVRSGYQELTDRDIKVICEQFKKGLVPNHPNLMTNIAIFTKTAVKQIIFNGNDKCKDYLATFTRQTIVPQVNESFDSLSISEASMILRSINVILRFPDPQLTNKILNCQVDVLNRASNMELYSLLDIALEVNLSVPGDAKLDQFKISIIQALGKCYFKFYV